MATLETRIKEFILQAGTDWKNIWAKMGTGALNTAAQNLTAAVNEVKSTADAAVGGTVADATTTVKGKVELATDAEALALASAGVVLTPSNVGAITNVNNGLAKLDSGGKVPSALLPAFVDDVLEFANFAALPGAGVAGVIYVTLDTNRTYRWGGSAYTEISAAPGSTDAVPEGATNLYYTATRADSRVTAGIASAIGNPDADLAAYYATAKA